MSVCQYFLEGRCRFGKNCRNEHITDDPGNKSSTGALQIKDIMRRIACEITIAEKGGQWPLSCFAPFTEAQNIPEWEDISPEEIRWKMYQARNNGTINQCINEVNQLYAEAEKKRNALKQPTAKKINLIVTMLKNKKGQTTDVSKAVLSSNNISSNNSIFGVNNSPNNKSVFNNSTAAYGNIFGGASQPLDNQKSIFGGNSTSLFNQNIFGGSNASYSFNQNIFSSTANQPLFSQESAASSSMPFSSQSVFLNNSNDLKSSNKSLNDVPLTSTNVFSSTAMSAPIFGPQSAVFPNTTSSIQSKSNIFSSMQPPSTENNSQSSNSFSIKIDSSKKSLQSNQIINTFSFNQVDTVDYTIYSKTEYLTTEEKEAFAAATFRFGKIPLKPPPLENCK